MGDGGRRGLRADAPPGHGGEGALSLVLAAEQQADGAAGLGGEMEAAGGGEADPGRNLGHDAGEAGVSEGFLHDQEGGLAPGLGVDDAGGVEACGGECGGEEVLLLEDPEDGAGAAGEDAGGEEGGGCGEFEVDAVAGDFVEGGGGESSAGEGCVDEGDAEGEGLGVGGGRAAFDAGDGGAEVIEGCGSGVHVPNLFSCGPAVNGNAMALLRGV